MMDALTNYVEINRKLWNERTSVHVDSAFYDVDMFLKQLKLTPDKQFYEPCSNTDIIKRVLRNLISAYEHSGSTEKVAELNELLAIVENP
ncbi:MAG: hypothetical protein EOP51_18560 [Sphingobacteriales bacterium]|nr:MAG: hypothetical protein EOP51_18560 [Sphingobacteriales bacterium]